MDKEHEYNKEIKSKRDMVIKYSDGTVVRLKWYKYGEHNLTFQDWDTKSFFAVPIEFDNDKLDNVLQFERFFQSQKIDKKISITKKKVYPYTWLKVLDIVFVMITYCTMIVLAFSEHIVMHFGWIFLIGIIHFMYHYWLDRQLPTLRGRLFIRICGTVYGYSIIVFLFVMI